MSEPGGNTPIAALACKKCGSAQFRKNGIVRGHQRYRCRACGCNFTDTPPRGYPLAQKVTAVVLYLSGLSMRRTARLLGVSPPTVQEWIERLAAAYATKPEPTGRAVVIELDEMWHFIKKKPTSCGSGKLTIGLQAAWLTGNAAVATETPPPG